MIVLMAAAGMALVSMTVAFVAQGRVFRMGVGVLWPLALTVLPIVQSIPLPGNVRRFVDPNGTALLVDNDIAEATVWPLSLDPVSTRIHVGRAAAALAIFIIAYHLGSGRRHRHLVARVVGVTGIAALTIAIGHRVLGFVKLYGILNATWRTPLVGPFVNSNHTAELLELCAFVCLACSFQRPTKLNRFGWLSGTLLCAGGAFATLSRGSVIALTLGLAAFVALRSLRRSSEEIDPRRRRRLSLAWGTALLGLIVLGGVVLGAGQLIERFKASSMGADVRFSLWRDGLRVLAAHPMGIGRGAFGRVFPVYRTVATPFPIRFEFLENEVLQLLVDSGWVFFVVLTIVAGVIGWVVIRRGRRDPIEAALAAGLIGVLGHNTVDFGLETLGILVPFMAVLGTMLGRMAGAAADTAAPARGRSWGLVGFVCAALVMGVVSLAHASADDFDALLKGKRAADERRALLVRAQQTHPLDYFYALAYARVVPLRGGPGTASPRLHALNRALRLCPACDVVHVEIARNLWGMGQRRQALLEWRSAVELNPGLMRGALGELLSAGASATELGAVASSDPARLIEVASFLSDQTRIDDAFAVLDQADAVGAAPFESLILRASLQLEAHRTDAAAATIAAAHRAGIQDARLTLIESRLLLAQDGPAAVDRALALLDIAAARDPQNLEVQRARIALVTRYQKWSAVPRSLEGLTQALYHAQGSATEAHILSARIDAQLGRWQSALGEYRIALADNPSDVTLWMEFGHQAAAIGRDATAREAYGQAARLSPNDPEINRALRQLADEQKQLRAIQTGGGSLVESPASGN
jgi:tetratricopeptide (TPR) repeat protein